MKSPSRDAAAAPRWLLLTHLLPAHPAYLRVKVWRRLQAVGAIAVKKSVYALPNSEECLEDFLWTAKEIEAAGGEALVCEARMLQGATDGQLRAQFDAAREADYRAMLEEGQAARKRIAGRRPATKDVQAADASLRRLRRRLTEIVAIDYFAAEGRQTVEALIAEMQERLRILSSPIGAPTQLHRKPSRESLSGRMWVTRKGVKVDRVACAWLIQRFIDPKATFRFVDPGTYAHATGEVRFDMAAAEFTHRGDRCSFEVLLQERGLTDPALVAIGEIIHDLDLKDAKFGRPETEGVRQFIDGLVLASEDDEARIRQASVLFDALYRALGRRPAPVRRGRRQ